MPEIEAKFILPDAAAFLRLQQIDRLAGYTLGPHQVEELCDTFLDTAGRAILSAGYYCRQREYGGVPGVWITVKSLGGGEGAVFRREELQISLPAPQPPAEWPAGPLRDRVLGWIGGEPLVALFCFRQVRTVRPVLRDGRPVAELSLDEVYLDVGRREETFLELEIELAAEGGDADLAAMVAELQAVQPLLPPERSKFERALALLGGETPRTSSATAEGNDGRPGSRTSRTSASLEEDRAGLLTPAERAVCRELARRQDLHGRRARALLAVDAGQTQEEAGRQAGMSERRVRYWQSAFRQDRLKIFPARVLARVQATPEAHKNDRRTIPSPPVPVRAVETTAESVITVPAVLPGKMAVPILFRERLTPDDTMAQAARKTLALHFGRMTQHEAGVRQGGEIESVHDMRVATRRMRAALRVFSEFLEADRAGALARDLRRVGRLLGGVRDMDVFRDKAQRYLDSLREGERSALEPLLAAWQAHYLQARGELLAYLDGERYARLKAHMAEFLQEDDTTGPLSPGTEPRPHRLRQVVPVALYQGLATVRAYAEWLTGPSVPLERYHQLRIASKGLRYTLEFFRDVLGPKASTLVERVKGLQDHLGDLQDAVVACNLLRDFLIWGTWGRPAGKDAAWPAAPILAPGVAAYLAYRQIEIQRLVQTFPAVWNQIRGPEFGQSLAQCVAVLL
jgi:CHAD domain-containing protein